MALYVDKYISLAAQLEQKGKEAAIPETHKAPVTLAYIDPKCPFDSTSAALRTKNVAELIWDPISIEEYNVRRGTKTSRNRSKKTRLKRRQKIGSRSSAARHSDFHKETSESEGDQTEIEISTRALAAVRWSVEMSTQNSSYHCDFFQKSGHTANRRYLNPENPNKKILPKHKKFFSAQAVEAEGGVLSREKRAVKKIEI